MTKTSESDVVRSVSGSANDAFQRRILKHIADQVSYRNSLNHRKSLFWNNRIEDRRAIGGGQIILDSIMRNSYTSFEQRCEEENLAGVKK